MKRPSRTSGTDTNASVSMAAQVAWVCLGSAAMLSRSAASTGSVYAHSSAWRYWPETLSPKFSLSRWDVRNEPVSTLCVPPASEMLVPCASSGDFVMMCSTPSAVFGP